MQRIILIYILVTISFLSHAQKEETLHTIKGQIIEYSTALPIAKASVSIISQNINTITDINGRFQIEGVRDGYQRVYVYCSGFKTLISESFLVSSSSNSTILEFELDNLNVALEEFTITASPLRTTMESPLSVRSIGSEEIDLTPGANRDISKVVQLSPGVVPISFGNRNDVLVRGGDANENSYYLDGIRIPVLNHFAVQGGSGGYASLVNTELLQGVKFYTGSFPSEFANGVSSVLDMEMKVGNSDEFNGKFIVGASDIGVNIDAPISKNGKTTLIASYRRSYLQVLFNIIGLPFLPTYNDYQFKVNSKLTNNDEIYLIGLGSFDKNKLNLSIENPDVSQQYILGYLPNNDQNSYVFGLGYKHRFVGGELRSTVSHNYLYNRLYKRENNDISMDETLSILSKTRETQLRSEVRFYNISKFSLKAGVELGHGNMNSSTFQQLYNANNIESINFDNKIDVLRYSLYSTLSRELIAQKLSASFALRADGMSYSSNTSNPLKQLSPRFSLTYNFAPKWSLGIGVGRYYQEPLYTTLSIAENESRLKYMAVNSYALGVDYSPNQNSKFKIEGFFKQYSNVAISLVDSLPLSTSDLEASVIGAVPAASSGRGRSYGVEFVYRNLDIKNTIINTSYTLMNSVQNKLSNNLMPISGEYWNSSWDVGHILNISAIHKFKKNWSLGAKWFLVGGLPYTPYDYELSSQIGAWDARNRPYTDAALYNSESSDVYHQLDLRLDKVWYFKNWRIGFYLDIQNAYNMSSSKQDLITPKLDSAGDKIIDVARPGHYKMERIESDYGGTILPTFGITIEI